MEFEQVSEPTSGVIRRRLRCLKSRPSMIVLCAGLLLLVCGATFVIESLSVLRTAHKMAQVDSGISASIAELRILHAKQAMIGQMILELASDGTQEIVPAWRTVAIHYRRHGQEFHGSVQQTLARVQMGGQRGMESNALVSQLRDLEEAHERTQNDVMTVIRLTDEHRSNEIAAMHATIEGSLATVTEQLDNLRNISQLALLNSAKQIQSSGHSVFWSGLGTIFSATFLGVRYLGYRRRKNSATFEVQPVKVQSESDTVEIAAEQALAERFLMRGVHVLVAEDDITSRRLLARVFENAGAVVTIACDGGQALHQFRKATSSGHPVQLVIMDLGMPIMDGIQVAMQLREVDLFEGPVLALTAENTPEMRADCLEAGFDDFLAKPIERKRILQLATDYLGKSVPAGAN